MIIIIILIIIIIIKHKEFTSSCSLRHPKPFLIHNTCVYNSVHIYLTKMIIQ